MKWKSGDRVAWTENAAKALNSNKSELYSRMNELYERDGYLVVERHDEDGLHFRGVDHTGWSSDPYFWIKLERVNIEFDKELFSI